MIAGLLATFWVRALGWLYAAWGTKEGRLALGVGAAALALWLVAAHYLNAAYDHGRVDAQAAQIKARAAAIAGASAEGQAARAALDAQRDRDEQDMARLAADNARIRDAQIDPTSVPLLPADDGWLRGKRAGGAAGR